MMVVFTQKINGVIGTLEWDAKDDTYDYHQEIARAGFADMLHDKERNQKYFMGLKLAIEKMHASGKPANVLDIGTGTGLLSMMAAQCGADSIVACEAFHPMAECAEKIIKDNNFQDRIKLIPKRSTDITVGEDGDMKAKANILVTEVFDTELIGEGALETFGHAHKYLLEENCIVVPHSATIYAQVVECPTLQRWNQLMDVADEEGDIVIKTPNEIKNCSGSAAVHDIQLSQLDRKLFKEITRPMAVLRYDWSGKTPLKKSVSDVSSCSSLVTGTAQMVFMWWDLAMDTQGEILLSCAPWWNHPDADMSVSYPQDTVPWRDHWMQGVYYFPRPIHVNCGDPLSLVSSQDEFSLWFNLINNGNPTKASSNEDSYDKRPVCSCGVHMVYSRTHVAYLNDSIRNKKMLGALRQIATRDSVVLCLNGSTLTGLAIATMGVRQVIVIESGLIGKRILNNYISHNNIENVLIVESAEAVFNSSLVDVGLINVVLGDPDYATSLLPWDNLYTAHLLHKFKGKLTNKTLKVIPAKCRVYTMMVEFLNLHKIKSPLNVCETLDLKLFDQLIEDSRDLSDDEIEPQPLWEYPCLSRSEPINILEVDLTDTQDVLSNQGSNDCIVGTTYNAFVFWTEWDLNGEICKVITTGPLSKLAINERISWDPHTRQGVKILQQVCTVVEGQKVGYKVKCDLSQGTIRIDVNIADTRL